MQIKGGVQNQRAIVDIEELFKLQIESVSEKSYKGRSNPGEGATSNQRTIVDVKEVIGNQNGTKESSEMNQ